jgi:hypothetical protein
VRTTSLHRSAIILGIGLLAGLLHVPANAQPSADEIVRRSLDAFYYPGDDMKLRVSMVLINPQGKERRRDFTMLRKDFGDEGDQKYFVYFHAPADVKGMTFMVWKSPTEEDDRWIFLPAISMVRRIAANDKRSSFVGSDFTYEDVSGRNPGDESHSFLRSEDMDGRPCYVIESTPNGNADYTRRVSWIDSERWLPLKEEYFDAREETVRIFTADEVAQTGEFWTVTKRTMQNLQTGFRTEVTFGDISYNVGLEENLFTERYLRQPPRRWIR